MGDVIAQLKSKIIHKIQDVRDDVGHALEKAADKLEKAADAADGYAPAKPIIISNSDINIPTVPDASPPSPPLSSLDGVARVEKVFDGMTLKPNEVGIAYDPRAKSTLVLKIGNSICVTAIDGNFNKGPLAARLRGISKNHSGYQSFKLDQSVLGPLKFELQEAMMTPIQPHSFDELNQATPIEYAMTAHFPEHDLHLNVETVLDVAQKVKLEQQFMQANELFELITQIGGGFVGKGQASDVVNAEAMARLPLPMRLKLIQESWGGAERALRMYAGTRSGVAGLEDVSKLKVGFEAPAEPMRDPTPPRPISYAGLLGGVAALFRRGARAASGEPGTTSRDAPAGSPPPSGLAAPNSRGDVEWAQPRTEPIDVAGVEKSDPVVNRPLTDRERADPLPAASIEQTPSGARVTLPRSGVPVQFNVGRLGRRGTSEGVVNLDHTTVSRDHATVVYNPETRTLSVENRGANGAKVVVTRTPLMRLNPGESGQRVIPRDVTMARVQVGDAEVQLDLRTGDTPPARPAAAPRVAARPFSTPQPEVAQPAVYRAITDLAEARGLKLDHSSGHKGDLTVRLTHGETNRLAVTFLPDTPAPVAKLVAERFVPAIQQGGARVRITLTFMNEDDFAASCNLYSVKGQGVQRAENGGLIRATLMRGNTGTTAAAGNRVADDRGLVLDLSQNDLAASGEHPIEFSVVLKSRSAHDLREIKNQLDMVAVRMRTLLRDANTVVAKHSTAAARSEPLNTGPVIQPLFEALGGPH